MDKLIEMMVDCIFPNYKKYNAQVPKETIERVNAALSVILQRYDIVPKSYVKGMDEHRKMAEELVLSPNLNEQIVENVANALRSTASKSEKDGYDRGRKDGRLLLEKIGKPLRRFDLTPGRTVEVSMDNINKLASAIVQALAIIETGKTLLVSTLSLSAKNSEK